MKIIAFEEHFKLPSIHQANKKANDPVEQAYDTISKSGHFVHDPKTGFPAGIYDLGEGRIAAMDEAGIDVQILSHTVPSTENLEPSLARELSTQANDAMAAAISKYPDRFLGFATLPMRDPAAAVHELERTVRDLHFVGALINGHVNGRYLDDKFFWPVFECAEALGVPIYLHPQIPPKPVVDAYYSGFAPEVSAFMSIAGLGWHIDTGIHCIRLILGGVFDRFPALQIIVGHHFEALSWMVADGLLISVEEERWAETDHLRLLPLVGSPAKPVPRSVRLQGSDGRRQRPSSGNVVSSTGRKPRSTSVHSAAMLAALPDLTPTIRCPCR